MGQVDAGLEGLEEDVPWDGGEPWLKPPTAAELEAWRSWELAVADVEEQLLENDGKGAAAEPPAAKMRELAERNGLTLERALVIRERAWSVLSERDRLLQARAVLAGLEQQLSEESSSELRFRRREAAEDVRRFTRAAASRESYGNAWVNAILRKEQRLLEVYRAAAAKAGRR